MIIARLREREYFANSPEYSHLNLENVIMMIMKCFQHLESVIKARIPSITSLINKSIDDLESELDHLGRPIVVDAGVSLL